MLNTVVWIEKKQVHAWISIEIFIFFVDYNFRLSTMDYHIFSYFVNFIEKAHITQSEQLSILLPTNDFFFEFI